MKIVFGALLRCLVPVCLTLIVGSIFGWDFENGILGGKFHEVNATLYSVCGIIFSVSVGLVVGMSFSGVKNLGLLSAFRLQNKNMLLSFLSVFFFATLAFCLGRMELFFKLKFFVFDAELFSLFSVLFAILHLSYNSVFLHRFASEVSDCVLRETINAERRDKYEQREASGKGDDHS